jgi:excisionase family DNA binding protein
MRTRVDKSVLTTGAVAKLIGLSTKKVSQLVDAGKLKGFKIPGSTHRRIARDEFEKFCAQYGIPIDRSQYLLFGGSYESQALSAR